MCCRINSMTSVISPTAKKNQLLVDIDLRNDYVARMMSYCNVDARSLCKLRYCMDALESFLLQPDRLSPASCEDDFRQAHAKVAISRTCATCGANLYTNTVVANDFEVCTACGTVACDTLFDTRNTRTWSTTCVRLEDEERGGNHVFFVSAKQAIGRMAEHCSIPNVHMHRAIVYAELVLNVASCHFEHSANFCAFCFLLLSMFSEYDLMP